MNNNGSINGIQDALEFCEERLELHQRKSQAKLGYSIMSLIFGATVIFYSYAGMIRSENNSSIITLAAFCVVSFGVFMALHRFHLTEVSKYEHYKLAFARLNIAQSFNERATDNIISSLTLDAFNFNSTKGQAAGVQSPLPGHPTSDLSALLVTKLMDNAKANQKTANK